MDNDDYRQQKRLRGVQRLRSLIWVYFWLWIFEGSLRKWVIPSLATPLLLIRDPIVIYMYLIAWRGGLFPRNTFLMCAGVLGWLTLIAGLFAMQEHFLVAIYGFRTDFLFLPFVFLVAFVFRAEDIRKLGMVILVLSIPMALLMVAQFRAPAHAFINAGEGEAFEQLSLTGDHIRAPGTFSYILGPVFFYSLAMAFLGDGIFTKGKYPAWLLAPAAVATGVAAVVSGSRSLLAGIGIVAGCGLIVGLIVNPKLYGKTIKAVCFVVVLVPTMFLIPAVDEGWSAFSKRIEDAGNVEGGSQGFVQRALGGYYIPSESLYETPAIGYGLGMGTNVGSALITGGDRQFLLSEGETMRVVFESGPILGPMFLFLRLALTVMCAASALRNAKQGNPLPSLLFGAGALVVLNGQWGVATVLGYATFACGLAFAAANVAAPAIEPEVVQAAHKPGRKGLRDRDSSSVTLHSHGETT